ncbi:hypothetical protein F4824DRAFT_446846 [Ustulina deusta]|nr:hypothetical protein F4823DRAFT_620038 [Ustulina deusta]KAI3341720.1 hypothetical protein F4824DRAFT_446846 [Ustulina deusta]
MERRGCSDDDGMKGEGKGKGKGKEEERARERPDTSSLILPAEYGSPNTMDSRTHPETPLSRLASSAAGLTGGLMSSRAHGQQRPSILPSGKAESSSTTQQPETAFRETARVTHVSSPDVRLPLGVTFRSTAGQDRGSSEKGFSAFLRTAQYESGELGESSPDQKISHVAAASMNDGSEVVDLLETGSAVEDDDNIPYMTNDELSALRRSLFGEGPLTGTGWNDVLDFVPEFISHHGSDEQLAQHLGVSDAAEARDIWFSQWGDVLSSYTDEVWGDLGPLVAAARQELQSVSRSPERATSNSLNAVRRLQQILAHVRGAS